MGFSYKSLWKLLIDKDMSKIDLRDALGLSPSTLAKLSKNKCVSMEVLNRICNYLGCKLSDVVEHVPDKRE